PELAHAQVAKLPLPAVERGLGDLELPADVRHRRPRFDLPQGEGDLLHTEPTRPHRTVPSRLRPGAIGPARNLPLSVSPRWSYYQGAPPRLPAGARPMRASWFHEEQTVRLLREKELSGQTVTSFLRPNEDFSPRLSPLVQP